jgi:hypothetical protein
VPYYLYLDNELVIITGQEYQRRKQVYYHTEDGRIKHASRFKKIPYSEIKAFSREYKLNLILE